MIRNNILVKGNLLHRGWTSSEQCYLCGHPETIKHLLFGCSLARFAWNLIFRAFDLVRPPDDVHDLISGWLDQFPLS